MKAHRIDPSMSVMILVTSFLWAAGSKGYAADPYGVLPPGGKHWTVTFEDDFTKDREIDKNKWNGGAGGTDWWNLDFHGKSGGAWMFAETNDPGGQHYEGCTLSRTNGLEMRSPGAPSAALQTGGTTARNAKFIQKFGYWEARFKVPHNTHGEGTGLHSDFWMHPIPEGIRSPTEWLPEINVGERPTWDANLDKANNKIYFGIHDSVTMACGTTTRTAAPTEPRRPQTCRRTGTRTGSIGGTTARGPTARCNSIVSVE